VGDAVRYEAAGGVATITLDSPDTRNALSADLLTELDGALHASVSDAAVRVVVLTGAGSTFCSGADLRAASADASRFAGAGPRLLVSVLEMLLDHPKPTIARVQGHVAGGGNGLVAGCDLAVATEAVRFAFSEVRLGVAPAVVAVPCLRVMSPRAVAELMLTGERVGAERALASGLVTAVVEPDALDATVAAWVASLLLASPAALASTKELLRRVPTLGRTEAFAWTAELSAALFAGDEAAEGITAFRERRPPSWAPRS
jgi:methylglutaconyl-CoA hydratase